MISQEVREFARLNPTPQEGANPRSAHPEEGLGKVEGLSRKTADPNNSSPALTGEGDHPQDGGGGASVLAEAEKGMARAETAQSDVDASFAEMSERYREGGNELYNGANGREHD